MRILVGSSALAQHIDITRSPKDVDYFWDEQENALGYDDKIVEYFNHPALVSWFGNQERTATLNELYTIKMSHSFWELRNKSWEKHIYDIMLMARHGAKIEESFYHLLYSIWEEVHGKKKANLDALPEDFFNKSVKRVYDHDSIHASIAYYDEPMYKKILRDGHPVLVDMLKWKNLSFDDKIKTVREEVYATALERQLIPSDYRSSPRAAYHWALKKTITSFSKGWFPYFIMENIELLWNPDVDYVARHKANAHKLIKLEEK